MRIFDNLNVDFISKRKTAYIISGTLILLGLIALAVRGLELGIDFKGGTDIALKFEQPIDIAQIRTELETLGLGNVEVKTFGGETGLLIRTELQGLPPQIYNKVVASIQNSIRKYDENASMTITDSSSNSVTFKFSDVAVANKIETRLQNDGYQISRLDDNSIVVRVGIEIGLKKLCDTKFLTIILLFKKKTMLALK